MIPYLGTFCLGIAISIAAWIYYFKKRPHFPPGPIGLPFIGNLHQLDKSGSYKSFIKLSKIYGDIIKLTILGKDVVVVQNDELIQEMLLKRSNDFADRPESPRISIARDGASGITFQNKSPNWMRRKKLLLNFLKAYGEGLLKLEEITHTFLSQMFENIVQETTGGKSVDMKEMLHYCTAGTITSIFYGEELKKDELDVLLECEKGVIELLSATSPAAIIDIFPFLAHLPIRSIQEWLKGPRIYTAWLKQKATEMIAKVDPEHPKSVFEELICYQQQHAGTQEALHDLEVEGISGNTIFAGFATTSTSLYIIIAILASRQDIQSRIHDEIVAVLGERRPSTTDRIKMPLTEAVILELLRYSSINPVLVPHAASKDTTLGGYDIPKGTMVLANTFNLHHDIRYWDEPFAFNPNRFLTDDGQLVGPDHINRKRLLPFGAGRRVCAGEVLAKNRIFLMLVSLLQKFRFLPEDPICPPNLNPLTYSMGLILIPDPYKVKVEEI